MAPANCAGCYLLFFRLGTRLPRLSVSITAPARLCRTLFCCLGVASHPSRWITVRHLSRPSDQLSLLRPGRQPPEILAYRSWDGRRHRKVQALSRCCNSDIAQVRASRSRAVSQGQATLGARDGAGRVPPGEVSKLSRRVDIASNHPIPGGPSLSVGNVRKALITSSSEARAIIEEIHNRAR